MQGTTAPPLPANGHVACQAASSTCPAEWSSPSVSISSTSSAAATPADSSEFTWEPRRRQNAFNVRGAPRYLGNDADLAAAGAHGVTTPKQKGRTTSRVSAKSAGDKGRNLVGLTGHLDEAGRLRTTEESVRPLP